MHYCDLYATLSGTLIVGAEGLFHTFLPYTTSKAGRSRRRRPESSACGGNGRRIVFIDACTNDVSLMNTEQPIWDCTVQAA